MKHLIIILLALYFFSDGFCQKTDSRQKSSTVSIFNEIETGIARGNLQAVAKYLSPQTYFSFSNGVNGYYSSNQAFYVLEDFFKMNQVLSFRFQNVQADENNSYATGIFIFENKGKRLQSQVYVSLVLTGKVWKINQITVN